jgi:hypothetical protein
MRVDVSAEPNCLPHQRNRRNAVFARRARPHRRDLRLRRAPPRARSEKPRVSAFTSANIDKILALKPYWGRFKKELRIFLCTKDKKYVSIRNNLSEAANKTQLAVVSSRALRFGPPPRDNLRRIRCCGGNVGPPSRDPDSTLYNLSHRCIEDWKGGVLSGRYIGREG